MPRLGLPAFRLRILVRSVFVLLALATVALSVVVLKDEKERAWQAYQHGFVRSQAEVMARLRHPSGQLALLNASHQALTYFGYLSGYRYAHEVTQDPLFETFLLNYMELEGTPTLMPVPGVDLDLYRKTLIARFANPEVKDTLARLCAESSDRIPKWLVAVIRANLASGGEIKRSAAVVASWARYAEGKDEQGEPIVVVDRMKGELMAIAQHNRENITAFIENREVFGDLCDNARFVTAYTEALQSLYHVGAKETVRRYA